jgi:hypothetical protein
MSVDRHCEKCNLEVPHGTIVNTLCNDGKAHHLLDSKNVQEIQIENETRRFQIEHETRRVENENETKRIQIENETRRQEYETRRIEAKISLKKIEQSGITSK